MNAPRQPSLAELAAGVLDDADVDVLRQLAGIYAAVDPVPAGLIDKISFGITLDALHAEIAELQRSDDLAGVRSGEATQAHSITFTSSSLTTMVTVTVLSGDRVRIDGWAAPGAAFEIELRVGDERRQTTADDDGRFVLEDVPRGLAQFVLRPPTGSTNPPVVTPAIEI